MEKKATIISLIAVTIIVSCTAAYIIFSGMIARDYNYVQIEVNPRVEFLCDEKFNVVSAYPLNDDAKIVISDMNFVGMDIDDATTSFLNECAQCGFIDVNGMENATNITVIDGITQALDVHVTQRVYDYYRANEIMCAVTETYEDRTMFDEKKENKIDCANKYKLIKTINELDPNLTIEDLREMKEVDLVKVVKDRHENNAFTPTEELISKKQNLKSKHLSEYARHLKAITKNSQREFSELFDKFQKSSIQEYQEDFEKQYDIWQENKSI